MEGELVFLECVEILLITMATKKKTTSQGNQNEDTAVPDSALFGKKRQACVGVELHPQEGSPNSQILWLLCKHKL